MSVRVKEQCTRNFSQTGQEQSHQTACEAPEQFGGFGAPFRKLASALVLAAAFIDPEDMASSRPQERDPASSGHTAVTALNSRPEIAPLTIRDLSEGDAQLIVACFWHEGIERALEPESRRAPSYLEKQEHRRKVQGLTAREILEQVAQVAKDGADIRGDHARSCVAKIETMLASPDFRAASETVRKVDPECQSPLGEIARVWSADGLASLEVFLHTFQSRDFREYLQQLREHVDVDIHSNIGQLVSGYSRNQVAGDSQSAARMIEAVKRLREAVPDVTIHSAEDLRTLAIRIPARGFSVDGLEQNEFHEWLGNLRRISEVLHRVAPGAHWPLVGLDYHKTVIPKLERLALSDAQALITFIQDRYPTLELRVDSAGQLAFSNEGLFAKYVEPIVDHLKVDGPTLDQFLGLFGRDISQVDLRALAEDRGQVFGLDIPAVLAQRDEFVQFLDDIFAQYPSLQEQVDASSINLLVRAFHNYETYRELNELVPSSGKLPVLSLEYADDKIEIAKVL